MSIQELPTLSVCVVSYNHEKYIKECIDSILAQEVDFEMEILVGNDCSTDQTATILEREYGDRITTINRKENLGLCGNIRDLLLRAKGKYVFLFAGDDYLYVRDMLARQVSFLEENQDYFSVSARNYAFFQEENRYTESRIKVGTYSMIDFLTDGGIPCIQGTMRNIFNEDRENNKFLAWGARNNEEIKLWTYVLDKGKKYIMDECMHVYRVVQKKGADNYCSRMTYLDLFSDYYCDLKIVESFYGKKYNFMPLRLLITNKYLLIVGKNLKDAFSLLAKLSGKDLFNLLCYKIYLKCHHYQKPEKWKKESYLLKRK